MRTRFLVLFALVLALTVGIRTFEAQNIASQGRNPADGGTPWNAYGLKTDTSNLQIQAAPGANLHVYIYMAYCVNTSASTQTIGFIKAGGTTYAAVNCGPAAIYAKPVYFDPPLSLPANTAVTMNSVASATTVYLFAAGTTAR